MADMNRQSWEDAEVPRVRENGATADEDLDSDYRAYTPRLMDTQEMQALRTALNRSEMQIQEQGHMKEYIPRKPASSKLRRWHGLPRNHGAVNRPVLSAGPSSRQDHPDLITAGLGERPSTAVRPMTARVKTAEFASILKKEARQVRELERRYEDTKRSLLEYIDVVISSKPNDRVGGQEVYEQLADLLSFAAPCNARE